MISDEVKSKIVAEKLAAYGFRVEAPAIGATAVVRTRLGITTVEFTPNLTESMNRVSVSLEDLAAAIDKIALQAMSTSRPVVVDPQWFKAVTGI